MALGIRNTLLGMPPVGQDVRNISNLPLIVGLFLEELDPHVRDGHGQAVVESDAAFVDGSTEGGHARDVFGDGDDVRVEFVQHIVGLRAGSAELMEEEVVLTSMR